MRRVPTPTPRVPPKPPQPIRRDLSKDFESAVDSGEGVCFSFC